MHKAVLNVKLSVKAFKKNEESYYPTGNAFFLFMTDNDAENVMISYTFQDKKQIVQKR